MVENTIMADMNSILVIVATLIFTVSTDEEIPHLVIKTSNEPLLTSRIEVSQGQNLSLHCVVYPNYHSALWQAKNEQIKSSDHIATLNIYNLRNSDLGTYNCESPSAHIQKTVDVVMKRKKRDDFQQMLDESNKLIDFIINEHKNTQYSKDDWDNKWDEYDRERAEFEAQREKRRRKNRNIGITVGALIIGCAIVGVLCLACKKCNKSTVPLTIPNHQQSNYTAQRLANTYEISPLCRPIETSITPYPPDRRTVSPSAPTAEPECPPPPSYEEVVCDASPSVPHRSAQNSAKISPGNLLAESLCRE